MNFHKTRATENDRFQLTVTIGHREFNTAATRNNPVAGSLSAHPVPLAGLHQKF
jgi:hypothetical protein